jgi:hypothetical protein
MHGESNQTYQPPALLFSCLRPQMRMPSAPKIPMVSKSTVGGSGMGAAKIRMAAFNGDEERNASSDSELKTEVCTTCHIRKRISRKAKKITYVPGSAGTKQCEVIACL